jgi:hypothetical protein
MLTVEVTEATPQVTISAPTESVSVGESVPAVTVYANALPVIAQVTSCDIQAGTADLPVTIYAPNGNTPATYNRTTGAANTVLLNSLHSRWGDNGVKAGRIVLPGGILHTVGTVIAPNRFSGMYLGCTPFNVTKVANRNKCLGVAEWFMERATGASSTWSPGFAMQTVGPEFQNIYFSSRYQLSGTWNGLEPSHLFHCAAYQVGPSHPGYFNGFVADSIGTGKQCFRSCAFEHGYNTTAVCFGYRDAAQSDAHNLLYELDWNADTPLFDFCGFWGSGSIVHFYNSQAYEATFRNCYYEPEFGPAEEWATLVRCYRGGSIHFHGGTITQPCRMVWVGPRAGEGKMFSFTDLKFDNFVKKEGRDFQFFDGFDCTGLQELEINATRLEFGYDEFPADNPPFFKIGMNQWLRVRDCSRTPKKLFALKSENRTGGEYGLTPYVFRPRVTMTGNRTRHGYTTAAGYTDGSLFAGAHDSANSTGSGSTLSYYFTGSDNADLVNRPFAPEEITE